MLDETAYGQFRLYVSTLQTNEIVAIILELQELERVAIRLANKTFLKKHVSSYFFLSAQEADALIEIAREYIQEEY